MEILIAGIIVVALMVWASTRIKRSAAAAFGAETIETPQFIIQKPDGWLSVVEPRDSHLFEAYTKDFGAAPNENVRIGNAFVDVTDGSIDDVASREISHGDVRDDIREVVADRHYRIVEMARTEDDLDRIEWLKFADAEGKVYSFRVKVLAETTAEFRRDIEAMIDSFEIK